MSQALFGTEAAAVAPTWLPRAEKDPSPEWVGAVDLGALGGTRTPNLLIRSQYGASSQYARVRIRRSGSAARPARTRESGTVSPVRETVVRSPRLACAPILRRDHWLRGPSWCHD